MILYLLKLQLLVPCSVQAVSPCFPWDDGKVRISWKGDGQHFVCSSVSPVTGSVRGWDHCVHVCCIYLHVCGYVTVWTYVHVWPFAIEHMHICVGMYVCVCVTVCIVCVTAKANMLMDTE